MEGTIVFGLAYTRLFASNYNFFKWGVKSWICTCIHRFVMKLAVPSQSDCAPWVMWRVSDHHICLTIWSILRPYSRRKTPTNWNYSKSSLAKFLARCMLSLKVPFSKFKKFKLTFWKLQKANVNEYIRNNIDEFTVDQFIPAEQFHSFSNIILSKHFDFSRSLSHNY